MKNKNLWNRMYKRTWTGKITMTKWSLGLVILVAAISGATATVLTKRAVKGMILKIKTPKSSEASNHGPPIFHETVCSAEFSENCIDG